MKTFFLQLRRLLTFLAVGAFFHAILIGAHFDFTSAWTWACLLAWPALALLGLLAGIVAFLIFGVVTLGVIGVAMALHEWNDKRDRPPARTSKAC